MNLEDEDDLSKDIAAAFEATEAPAPPAVDAPPSGDSAVVPPSAEKPEGERARDESGKFVKKDETEKPAAPDKQELAAAKTATAAQQQAQPVKAPVTPQTPAIAAPQNWKGNGKVEWARLPQHIQKEISDDYARNTETQGRLAKLDAAIGDRSQVLAAQYGSVEQGLQNLFAISDMATKNPQGFLLWFAQQRGINLTSLTGQDPPQGEQPADASHPLMAEVSKLRSQLQDMQTHQQAERQSQLQAEISSFGSDPSRPYFNDVRLQMAALMQSGSAKTLQEAYDQAVWARPDIRGTFLEEERKRALEANAAIVAKAKQAAGSLTGHPGSKTPDDEPDEDLDATIRRSVNRAFAA